MMSRFELADELRKLVPASFFPQLVVAGSYATNPNKAEDIDLWILGIAKASRPTIRQICERHLKAKGIHHVRSPKRARYGEEKTSHFDVVADLNSPDLELPVQILTTTHSALSDLLAQFDISTHIGGFYLAEPEVTFLGEGFTLMGETPRVVNFHRDPRLTLERLFDICERYGHKPHSEDVITLEEMIDGEWRDGFCRPTGVSDALW